jgi:hypothetical protein
MLLLVVVPVAVARVLADEPVLSPATDGGTGAQGSVTTFRQADASTWPAAELPGEACGTRARLLHGGGLNRSLEYETP